MRVSLLRRLAARATTLGLTSLGLLGAGTAPAQAAVGDCPAGHFCAWKSDNGTGSMVKTDTSKATLGDWENTFRTVVNRTSKIACLYGDPDYGQSSGTAVWYSDPAGTEWGHSDGSVSSVRLVPTERECTLPAYPRWYAPTAPQAAGSGDLTADRRADVLVRDMAGRLWFLPGRGTGGLAPGVGGGQQLVGPERRLLIPGRGLRCRAEAPSPTLPPVSLRGWWRSVDNFPSRRVTRLRTPPSQGCGTSPTGSAPTRDG